MIFPSNLLWTVVVGVLLCALSLRVQGWTAEMDSATQARYDSLIQAKTCDEWLHNTPEDCLKSHHGACVAVGCNWIANYPGPWCQFPVPKHCIPSSWDIFYKHVIEELSNIQPLQWTAGFFAVVIVGVIAVLMVWVERRQNQQQAEVIRHGIKDEDEEEEESLVGTRFAASSSSTGSSSSSSTTMRRRKGMNEEFLEDKEFGRPVLSAGRGVGGMLGGVASARKMRTPWWLSADAICCLVLFALSMAIHLWRLEEPPILTYDECHFGYFVSKYFKREYLFDIHPPLAKMTFYVLGALLGHDPGPDATFQFKGQMGTPYHNFNQFYPLRFIASFFGSLVVPLMYLCCRTLKVSPSMSIVGASLVLWDTCLLAESRAILTDSQLVFWNVLTLYTMLNLFTLPSDCSDALRTKWMVATALCCGCVFGVKFTSLATLGLIAVEAFFGIFLLKKPFTLVQCVVSGLIGMALWMLWWWCHFAILIYDHSEVSWQDPDFQASLIGNEWYGKVTPPWFPIKTFQLVITMIQVNAKTLDPHNWSSLWHNWIIGRGTRVLSAHEDGWEISIFTNPAVIWLTCISIAVGGILLVLFYRYKHADATTSSTTSSTTSTTPSKRLTLNNLSYHIEAILNTPSNRRFCNTVAFLMFGWLMNLLPYIFIARTTFVYHYLPGLLYVQVLTAFMGEKLLSLISGALLPMVTGRNPALLRNSLRIGVSILLVSFMALGWWYFAPWIYAIPLTNTQHEARRLFLGK